MAITLKCPVCGGGTFIEGYLNTKIFWPVSFEADVDRSDDWSGKLHGRLCKNCGFVMTFLPVGAQKAVPDV
jgi:hypothetical protein